MSAGDAVVYLADVLLYGVGRIVEIRKDGWVTACFDHGAVLEAFRPHEIELLSKFTGQTT